MNCSFKTVYHGGYDDQKPIVTMSVTINKASRFNKLDGRQADDLLECLNRFIQTCEISKQELIEKFNIQQYANRDRFIEKERQQIINAHWKGRTNHEDICSITDCENYYNQTYNQ